MLSIDGLTDSHGLLDGGGDFLDYYGDGGNYSIDELANQLDSGSLSVFQYFTLGVRYLIFNLYPARVLIILDTRPLGPLAILRTHARYSVSASRIPAVFQFF